MNIHTGQFKTLLNLKYCPGNHGRLEGNALEFGAYLTKFT